MKVLENDFVPQKEPLVCLMFDFKSVLWFLGSSEHQIMDAVPNNGWLNILFGTLKITFNCKLDL